MRIAIGLEYNGSAYCGWQRQTNGLSIQETLEKALSLVADEPIHTICAGRTDAGVHAFNQVVHFDTNAERSERAWLMGTNNNLPRDITLRWVRPVSDDFSARFSATARTYRYIIHNHNLRSALHHQRAGWFYYPLNEHLMHEAAQCLLGEHDFSSFRAGRCQAKSPVRVVREVSVHREGDFVIMEITANAFLYHMVRNIVGSLVLVGSGREPVSWMAEVLAARDRHLAGKTFSPDGLYFVDVEYKDFTLSPFDSLSLP